MTSGGRCERIMATWRRAAVAASVHWHNLCASRYAPPSASLPISGRTWRCLQWKPYLGVVEPYYEPCLARIGAAG